jgi:CarD family transcriptional regulator
MTVKAEFSIGERVVYPSHGVGEIINIETQVIGGMDLKMYVVSFPQDKLTVKVPINRAAISGLRTLANKVDLSTIYTTLQGKPNKRTNRMWSRRAQEYENKINSGNIVAVAEVVRDLFKDGEGERSYSERTIYESALDRLAREVAALESIAPADAVIKLVDVLKEKLAA